MNSAKEFMRNILFFTIVVIVLTAAAAFIINQADSSRKGIPVMAELPDFEFTERSGVPFGLDKMKGRINVVDFIFTNCPGPCPMMSAVMSDLFHFYGSSEKIRFISISVDPLRDTLEALQAYAEKFGVTDNGWLFLRAEMDKVNDLYEKGFLLAGDIPGEHSTRFVLVDADGMIRGYYQPEDNASMELLKMHIKQLAREM
ncbi:MAG: SCO family protein [Candidatus Zixiibacteriota bacterium]